MSIKNRLTLKEISASNLQLPNVIKFAVFNANPNKISKILTEYENSNSKIIGAIVDKDLVGVIGTKYNAKQVTIIHISVIPDFQGQKIGRKLIESIIDMHLSPFIVAETDDEAIGFYQKLGFDCSPFLSKYGSLRYECKFRKK